MEPVGTGTGLQIHGSEFDSHHLLHICGRDGIGIRIGLKIRVLRVRVSPSAPIISTSDLTLATEEVRDLWQVRVGEIYFGIS